MTVIIIGLPLSITCFALARKIPMWMGGEMEILDDAEMYNKIVACSLVFRSMTMMLTAIYRGYGDSKTPMSINVLVNILNVVGNYIMIYPTREISLMGQSFTMFGCGWGVAGAALSTTLSGILGGLMLLIICFARKSDMQISVRGGCMPKGAEVLEVFRISMPAMLERFIMGVAFIVVGHEVATLGTAAVAAQNLSGTAESLSFMPGFAFGAAITTLFGQSVGAGRADMAKCYVKETIKLGSAIMAAMTALMYIGSAHIMAVFTPDAEVIAMGSKLLKILAVIQIPQMIAMVYSGALKGAGDSQSPFLIALISMWGIRLLGTRICIHYLGLGLTSACVCMCADNALRCLLFHLRYRQGKWKQALNA